MESGPKQTIRSVPLLVGVLGGLCILFWICLIPYAAGHGDGRERIITWLSRHWFTPTWYHGAFIPIAAGFMVWSSRKRLSGLSPSPAPWGFLPLILGFLFLWAGYRTHVVYIGLFGTQLLVAGFIISFLGGKHFRALIYPFCFLALTWPLPFLEASLSFHLRVWMTEASTGLLNIFGAGVERSGTALTWTTSSGPVHMEIEGACSGLRSLFSLFAAAALYAFFVLRNPTDRGILLLAAVPIAIVGNIVRIVALYLGVNAWGWETAVGTGDTPSTYHMFAGILVIAVGVAGIVLLASALKRRHRLTVRTRVSQAAPEQQQSPATGGQQA